MKLFLIINHTHIKANPYIYYISIFLGLAYSRSYRLLFLFSNQIAQKIDLKCSFNGNEVSSYQINGHTRYYYAMVTFQAVGEVVFTARTVDGNDIVAINGDQSVTMTIIEDKYLYRMSMFTFDEGTVCCSRRNCTIILSFLLMLLVVLCLI